MERRIVYRELLDALYEGVYFVDNNRVIKYWNKGAERITGYRSAKVLNSSCKDNILVHIDASGVELCKERCPLVVAMETNAEHREDAIYLHHKDGHRVPVRVSVSTIRDNSGKPIGAVEIFTENIARSYDRDFIESLQKAALLDPLTNLPNRRYIGMKLVSCFEEMKRHNIPFGVLFMDIDLFKTVNDVFGHTVGDRVLKMLANTLENNMRAYDLAGRWGGEEFMVVIQHTDEERLISIAQKLKALVEHSFLEAEGRTVKVTVTIGGAFAQPGDTPDSIQQRADKNLYEGKSRGRNCVVF